ncbi:MAG: 50S ribosomal protein L25 [Candidatus Jordarchaeaceae archaeon]
MSYRRIKSCVSFGRKMNRLTLVAEKRKIVGRKVKKLRREGILPANLYGKKIKSQEVQVKLSDFEKVYKEAGETGLVELVVNGDKKPVLIHNVQFDPIQDNPLHVDFLQVDLKEKVTAQIPVELVGESPAEKQGLGTVVQYVDEIEVEALPVDLPDKFEIDASRLSEVDQAVLVKDLRVDSKKVEVKVDPEQIIAKVEPPRKEEEVAPKAPAEEEEEEVEVAKEVPAEGEGEEAPQEQGKEEVGKK